MSEEKKYDVIVDIEGRVMKIEHLKVITHEMNIENILPTPMVEFTVIGKSGGKWRDFMMKNVFDLLNPHVKVE